MNREGRSYLGPVTTARIPISGRIIRVVCPADPERLLDDPTVLERNSREDYMPYWAFLWPGAYLLAEAVAREAWAGPAEALEIGCGLGLAGLTALAVGLRVTFSDYDEEPLSFVARSVRENGHPEGSCALRRLDWRDPVAGRFPIILGADVLYEPPLVTLVGGLLHRMLAAGGVALLAGPYRVATEGLPAVLEGHGLRGRSSPIEARTEHGRVVRGMVHRVERPV